MNLPQETLGLRRPCFSHGSRYSYRHSLFCEVHQCSRSGFNPHTMLLYRCLRIPLLRCRVLAPLHFRRWITRPVSYYALFECVAASKPTSWLFRVRIEAGSFCSPSAAQSRRRHSVSRIPQPLVLDECTAAATSSISSSISIVPYRSEQKEQDLILCSGCPCKSIAE